MHVGLNTRTYNEQTQTTQHAYKQIFTRIHTHMHTNMELAHTKQNDNAI